MKTLKIILAALAISLTAGPAFADPPVDAQRKLQKAEMLKRAKDKGKAGKDSKGKAKKADKNDKANKGKGKSLTHGKEDKFDKTDRPNMPDLYKPKEHPAKPDRAGAEPDPVREDVASKRNANSARGLDRSAKEERKHLKRMAKIQRIAEIAQRQENTRLLETTSRLREKENLRHQRALNKKLNANESNTPDAGS